MDRHDTDANFNYETTLAKELGDWFGVHFRTKDARLHKMLEA